MPTRSQILAQLPQLRPSSGKRISDSIIWGFTHNRARYDLIRTRRSPSGWGMVTEPTEGWDHIGNNLQARRQVMTLPTATENNFTHTVNDALLGGDSYPVLNAALGTAVGVVSGGAGLIFTVATTALDLSRQVHRVLARGGDQVWCVEEIGKRDGDVYHVGAFFIVDPYRTNQGSTQKGWLIHEQRTELELPD